MAIKIDAALIILIAIVGIVEARSLQGGIALHASHIHKFRDFGRLYALVVLNDVSGSPRSAVNLIILAE